MKTNKQLLLTLVFVILGLNLFSQVIISSDTNDVANPSAALEIRSTTKGLLPPRMTADQRDAIVNPAPGLIIYCVNCGDYGVLQLRNNYQWVDILNGPLSGTNYAPVATNVSVSGTTIVFNTLTATYTYSDVEGNQEGTSLYNWYRADNASGLNEVQIDNAHSLTYNSTETDFLKYIRFGVIPIAAIGTNPGLEVKSAWTAQILSLAPEAHNVAQTGNITVGSILTGAYTYADPTNTPEGTSIYKWYRADNNSGLNEILIIGATGLQYTIQPADLGKYIRFAVIPVSSDGTVSHGDEVKATIYSGAILDNVAPIATAVTQSGIAINGKTLVGTYTYSDYENDIENNSTIKWFVADDNIGTNEQEIVGANSLTYVLQTSNIGKYIRFAVIPKSSTGTTTGVVTKSTTFIGPILNALPEAQNVAITGNLSTGSFITANYTYYDLENDAQSGVTYKWYRSDNSSGLNRTLIAGASSNTYLLSDADLNRFISVSVTVQSSTGRSPGDETFSPLHGSIIFLVQCGVQVLTSTLNVGVMIPSTTLQTNNGILEKYCYNNAEENCLTYGGFYNWKEAMNYAPSSSSNPGTAQGICPTGFHIPSDLEFSRYEYCVESTMDTIGPVPLVTFQTMNGARGTRLAVKLKSATWSGTNISGFSILPSGIRYPNGTTSGRNSISYIWTSTSSNSLYSWIRYFSNSTTGVFRQSGDMNYGFSVRCFKN